MRTSTLLWSSLAAHGACWIAVAGLHATMNGSVPQYFFGFHIPHFLTMAICLATLAGMGISVLGIVIAIIRIVEQWMKQSSKGDPGAG